MRTYISSLLAYGMATTAFVTFSAFAADNAHLERWRSYTGVTWDSTSSGKEPTPFANSVNAPIAGIRFDAAGRAFVSTPRLISSDAPATLSILDTSVAIGPARLTAFPSTEANAVSGTPSKHLRSVLGFYTDRRNGWLWALDQGFVAGETEAPEGGQKIVVYDLRTREVVKTIGLDAVADRKGSFLNDIAVDEARKVAYISDSGLRSAPENQAGIIVADLTFGTVRRVLHQHPSVMPEMGAKVMSHGSEVWPDKPLVLGVNGIALSPDASTLYWAVTSSTHAYAISTALLRSPDVAPATMAAAIRDLGDVGGNTDGIVTDAAGTLYITDVTRNGIVRYDPRTRSMALFASNDGVRWPDTPAIGYKGELLFTASNLNQHFAGQIKPQMERYEIWRVKRNQNEKR